MPPDAERLAAMLAPLRTAVQPHGRQPAADRAFSANTARAVKADLAVYAAWCRERRLAPLPADPGTIAAFVHAMAETRAPATVRRYVASIAVAHRATGHPETV